VELKSAGEVGVDCGGLMMTVVVWWQ
jgi:hypothetical protein